VLSARYRASPYWWDSTAPDSLPAGSPAGGPLPVEADVLVVGAGYTGLGAALELARAGRATLVVDRDAVASGASSRNGGMVHPGGKHSLSEYLAMPDGRALWDVTIAAFDNLEALVAECGIDCDWRRTGHLELAHHPRVVAGLRTEAEAFDAIGEPASFVDRDGLAAEVGSDAYHGGLLVHRSGALHPARLAAGLAAAAAAAGAGLAPHTTVHAIERAGTGFVVHTDRGAVRAGEVVVATNGYTGSLVPWLGRRVLPIGSYIIATEPINGALASSVSPRGRMLFDTRNFLCYWRLSPDGTRVLFGGRTSFAPTTVERSRNALYERMVRIHPQLAGVALDHAWGGNVALTADRMPHIGRHPGSGVVFSMGYCGTGVAMATHLGRLTGRWLTDRGGLPAHAGLRWPRLPAPARVDWLLPVAGWWYHARDRLGL
jgi:glycine/D-amino acid oxidase-like deaminating enzyme